jgi:hypothetical protein
MGLRLFEHENIRFGRTNILTYFGVSDVEKSLITFSLAIIKKTVLCITDEGRRVNCTR